MPGAPEAVSTSSATPDAPIRDGNDSRDSSVTAARVPRRLDGPDAAGALTGDLGVMVREPTPARAVPPGATRGRAARRAAGTRGTGKPSNRSRVSPAR
ncbi:hypothetical protein Ssi03_22740 [Sphaerisporangium siamense]|nr:hypothetical protein Ssi03_22740 [Sphaerisporangium siamense]